MSAHTPGPWSARDSGIIELADGTGIADVWRHPVSVRAARANARLIAAAPDLLAALELLLECCESGRVGTLDEHAVARAAIAKAEGKP